MSHRSDSGFALIAVLWTLVLLSTIALTLAATVRTETQSAQDLWNELQAERLASSGHEFADYLETRGIGSSIEDFNGLPVQPVVPGFSYRVRLDIGSIDLFLEGENGKLDLASAGEEVATRFFTNWTGDANRGRQISDSLLDWMDPDDELRPMGAEAPSYSAAGYLPRNSGLGSADLLLLKGLTSADFFPSVTESREGLSVRSPLPRFLSSQTGTGVNPNYASTIVLQSLPGISTRLLEVILEMRRESFFKDREDFRLRTGLSQDSPLLKYVVFDRGSAPAILARATVQGSARLRVERRAHISIRPKGWRPGMRLLNVVGLLEREVESPF